ncbi:LPXTG cell wall anchor domain-containing protein [Kutzneria sp. 744]|uniref:LPXTG cell wall anchor domain-containing protein n=1 Tax=Kutzneria sp. (strain 744) TaxID=345341 RepID=UPI0003EEB83C|nr:LPXTG cell wall anchor domain-containing protein [Kutzneria sp. 744]EWM15019.1 LigA protein [Kutzneria sp. 744]
MKRFAVAALAVGLPLLSVATAHASSQSYTVSGVAWKDLNGDGIRQSSEPLLPGIKIGSATTDANGRYKLEMPSSPDGAGSPPIQAGRSIEDGRFVLTRPSQGPAGTNSDFDWNNGWLQTNEAPVQGLLDNIDVGYMPTRNDAGVKITPKQTGPVHVGDDVVYEIAIDNNAFPSYVGVRVVFPEGVTLAPFNGVSSWADPVGTTGMDIRFLRAIEPNETRIREVSGKVTKPIDGVVTADLIDRASDVDGANDKSSAPLKTAETSTTPTSTPVATQPTSPAPNPKPQPVVAKSPEVKALANTGADPTWPLIGGLVLLAAGVGTVLFARRRRA